MHRPSLAALISASFVLACGGGGGSAKPLSPNVPVVAAVTITPRTMTLFVGGSGTLSASVTAAGGAVVSTAPTWSTANGAIASVTAGGLVTGISVGQTQVVAAAGGKADTAVVVVRAPFTLEVTPAISTTSIGQSVQYTVRALDPNGAPLAVTPPVTWASSAPAVATVSTSGTATGLSVGATSISARSGTVTSNAAVLNVTQTSQSSACFGIANQETFKGLVTYGYKAVKQRTEGGLDIDADDNATVAATMVRTTPIVPGMLTVQWSAPASGSASMTQRASSDGQVTATKSGGGAIADLPQGLGRPKLSLTVYLSTCTFLIVTGATVDVRTTEFGTTRNAIEQVSQVQFAGQVPPTWATNGMVELEPKLSAASAAWSALNPEKSFVIPLGYAASLFNPIDRQVGLPTGSYSITK